MLSPYTNRVNVLDSLLICWIYTCKKVLHVVHLEKRGKGNHSVIKFHRLFITTDIKSIKNVISEY